MYPTERKIWLQETCVIQIKQHEFLTVEKRSKQLGYTGTGEQKASPGSLNLASPSHEQAESHSTLGSRSISQLPSLGTSYRLLLLLPASSGKETSGQQEHRLLGTAGSSPAWLTALAPNALPTCPSSTGCLHHPGATPT